MRKTLELLAKEINFKIPDFVEFCIEGEALSIVYDGKSAVVRGKNMVMLAKSLVEMKGRGFSRPFSLQRECQFDTMGMMADMSRNAVMNVESVKKLVRVAALCGYNMFQLYTEDTYTIKNRPYFGYLRGRYSSDEIKEIDRYCQMLGIELVPCIQTLAHLNAITKWGAFGEVIDIADTLLCKEEKTYELIEDMFCAVSESFCSRRINIGMDEAVMAGLGKYLKKHGYKDRFDLLTEHLNRVCEIADKYGFRPMMWSDMFFRLANDGEYYGDNPVPQRAVDRIPDKVALIYWDYRNLEPAHYDKMITRHKELGREVWTANAAWKFVGIAPNNDFTFKAMDAFLPANKRHQIKNTVLTLWGDNGGECSVFSVLPSIVYMSEQAYSGGDTKSCDRALRVLTGIGMEDYLAVDIAKKINNIMPKIECPDKYFLYNDLFCGFLDPCYIEGYEEEYKQNLGKFKKGLGSRYGYVFRTLYDYCYALSIRLGLGIRTREAYQAGNKELLLGLANNEYKALERALEKFYKSFRAQWYKDNKPYGFEVQDIRLGGLIRRVRHCRERLIKYCAGKTGSIDELEQELLPFAPNLDCSKNHIVYYNWANYVTVNTL